MNTPKQAVTAHSMSHWGLPKELHRQGSDPFELAVIDEARPEAVLGRGR